MRMEYYIFETPYERHITVAPDVGKALDRVRKSVIDIADLLFVGTKSVTDPSIDYMDFISYTEVQNNIPGMVSPATCKNWEDNAVWSESVGGLLWNQSFKLVADKYSAPHIVIQRIKYPPNKDILDAPRYAPGSFLDYMVKAEKLPHVIKRLNDLHPENYQRDKWGFSAELMNDQMKILVEESIKLGWTPPKR